MLIQNKGMDISDMMMNCLALEPLNLGTWAKSIEQRGSEQPSPRQYHSAIFHKISLYIYGGIPQQQPEDHLNEQRTVYRYNTSTKAWSKSLTNFLNNNSFSYIYSHSAIIFNNMMYVFGGKNYRNNQYIIGLWCLNLESFNWKRQQLKGYSPLARENASMVLHQRNLILLYGGRKDGNNLNDLHIYKIQNKIWIQIEQSCYDMKIPCRLKPAITSQGDYIYIFGGERMIAYQDTVKNCLLDDFYQIKLLYRPMSTKPDVWVKQIITNVRPAKKIGHFINLNQKYLMLWGGENYYNDKMTCEPGFWIYSIQDVHWNWIKIKGNLDTVSRFGYSITYGNDKCYIFGQIENNQKKSPTGLMTLNLDLKQIDNKLNENKYKPKLSQNELFTCNECYQNKKSIIKGKFNDFIILKESLADRIQYIYSAFGLLADNSLILKAKQCRITFHQNGKQKYCLFQDNGNFQSLWQNYHDFITDLSVLRTYVQENIDQLQEIKQEDISKKNFMKQQLSINPNPPPISTIIPSTPLVSPSNLKQTKEQKEQKQKQLREKQQQKQLRRRKEQAKRAHRKKIEDRKQFSRNIKLGSLRIGDKVIFINKYGSHNENRNVFVIEKNQSSKNHYYIYRTYYYVYQNGALVQSNMDTAKRYIDEQYKIYIKMANDRKEQTQNFLFITGLKDIVNEAGQMEPELKQSSKHGDVFCCEKRVIQSLEDPAFLQSIDISLKNYLTLLYLKNDQMRISLAISDNKFMQISNLEFFQKIDNLVKSQKIIDLVDALDIPNCNIIEVYYNKGSSNRNRDANRKTNSHSFLNGVLLYQKNRLICRYKYNLGEVSKLFKNKIKNLHNFLMMFGFIEIKEEFNVNIFKTAFIRDDELEQIYHRLKFIQKYAQRYNNRQDSRSRPLDDKSDKNNKGRKQFKANEQAKQEPPNIITIDIQ